MQLDMHYYGTYAMARAAGIAPRHCRIIATASQYVDDNAAGSAIHFEDGARLDVTATAHHTLDIANIDPHDQRLVWIPFHFIPGNQGNTYSERLVCRQDSKIAREMVLHHVALSDRKFYLPLLGIMAHVYADTFSHYGFSGVSSRRNRIDSGSLTILNQQEFDEELNKHIEQKKQSFLTKYGREGGFLPNFRRFLDSASSEIAELSSGALGHGAVLTYPDRPFLIWQFDYEDKDGKNRTKHRRNNPKTFLQGCKALYNTFLEVVEQKPDLSDGAGKPWTEIESTVEAILQTPGPLHDRITTWQQAAQAAKLFSKGSRIPAYDAEVWRQERKNLDQHKSSNDALKTNVYRFHQAASLHRNYVLRDLLPKYGLLAD